MPKASEPRIVVRVSTADAEKLDAAAKVAAVGTSTLLRESALRDDRYLEVGRQLAAEKAAKSSGGNRTVAAPPEDPVPPAASPPPAPGYPEPFTYRCPAPDCDRGGFSPVAVCPVHGRRMTEAT